MLSLSVVSDSLQPQALSPGSSVNGILQARRVEWVAISFPKQSSQPRDRTQVSCSAGGFFTVWATKEVLCIQDIYIWHIWHTYKLLYFQHYLSRVIYIMKIQKNCAMMTPSLQWWRVHANLLSCVWLFVTRWTIAHQASLSMGVSRQEYWSGLPRAPPRALPDPVLEPASTAPCTGRQVLYH